MSADWFAARLRELREERGLTQQQLAEAAGLTRIGVAQLEAGRREPAWRTAVSLCRALGVSPDAFLKEPAATTHRGPGRPPKNRAAETGSTKGAEGPAPKTDGAEKPTKRPRGRPKKQSGG